MTIASTTTKQTLLGDGTTCDWPFTFRAWKDEIRVIVADAAGFETDVTALSTVELDPSGSGGVVTYPAAPLSPALPMGHRIVIMRDMDLVQETRLVNVTRFDPAAIENQLDRLIANDQQLQEQVDRALTVGVASGRDPGAVIEEVFQARDRAETAASGAAGSEGAAAASAAAADGSATAAADAARDAEAWAEEAKEVVITGGPDASPTIRGLAPAGGTAGQVYRTNAAGDAYGWEALPIAESTALGVVRPDGKTTFVDAAGVLSAAGAPLLSISWELCTAPLPGKLNLSLDNGLLPRSAWTDAWGEIQATRAGLLITDAAWLAEVAAQGSCAKYSSGDGSTTFRVPLLRRVFMRAADPVSGLTTGAWQTDTMRPIVGEVSCSTSGPVGLVLPDLFDGTGPFYPGANKALCPGSVNRLGAAIGFDSGRLGAHFNGVETSPVAVVLTPYMQMYGVVTNAGALDIAALVQGLSAKLDASRYDSDRNNEAFGRAVAYARFTGQSTPAAIVEAKSIATITRTGTGVYSVTFSQPMSSKNYLVLGADIGGSDVSSATGLSVYASGRTTNGFTLHVYSGGGHYSPVEFALLIYPLGGV